MAPPVPSTLFGEFRSAWPSRPYPLLVDHADVDAGRVCPAASLYALGKHQADRLVAVGVQPGEVVACRPETWIEWVGVWQACLRRGAAFAPVEPGSGAGLTAWSAELDASVEWGSGEVRRVRDGRRAAPNTLIAGPPPIALTEPDLVAATDPMVVDPLIGPEDPVWLDHRLSPLAKAVAVVTLLRAKVEVHLGLATEEAVRRADDDHRLFGGSGGSSSMAAVRAWADSVG